MFQRSLSPQYQNLLQPDYYQSYNNFWYTYEIYKNNKHLYSFIAFDATLTIGRLQPKSISYCYCYLVISTETDWKIFYKTILTASFLCRFSLVLFLLSNLWSWNTNEKRRPPPLSLVCYISNPEIYCINKFWIINSYLMKIYIHIRFS